MTNISSTPFSQFCWVDLMTPDVAVARSFYAAALGWEAREGDPEFGGYFMFFNGDVPVAGAMPNMSSGQMPSAWRPYIAVEDAAASLEKVTAEGGTLVSGAMDVGTLGTMGIFLDPSGGLAGVWQPKDFSGFGAIDDPGAARWFELHTPGFANAKTFYEDAFGWTTSMMSDADEFRYATANEGEAQFAGLNDTANQGEGKYPHWLIYFGVASCDDAVEAAKANGGTVMSGPDDTPYGRLAVITDPGGAVFALMQ